MPLFCDLFMARYAERPNVSPQELRAAVGQRYDVISMEQRVARSTGLEATADARPVVFREDMKSIVHPVAEPPVQMGMFLAAKPCLPADERGLAPPAALVAVVVVGRRGRVVAAAGCSFNHRPLAWDRNI